MATDLIVVRHGHSEGNLRDIFLGQGELPLTPLGREQAARVADYLKNEPIAAIYSSDLSRAYQTAEPTAKIHGVPIVTRRELREIDGGEWEWRLYADLAAENSPAYRIWMKEKKNACPPGGESVAHIYERIGAEMERIVKAHPGETVAVFTHATPALVFFLRAYGLWPDRIAELPWAQNASVSRVRVENGTYSVLAYGETGFLEGIQTALPKTI